jgi:transposase
VESIASKVSKRRPNFSVEFKAKLAAKAGEPGVSVSKLALEHGINTNMLFRWRRQYRSGELCAPVPATVPAALMPVSVVAQSDTPLVELPSETTRFGGAPAGKPVESAIEIQIAGAVVRVQGEVDILRLRAVLAALSA